MWFFAICELWGCSINKMIKNKVKELKKLYPMEQLIGPNIKVPIKKVKNKQKDVLLFW